MIKLTFPCDQRDFENLSHRKSHVAQVQISLCTMIDARLITRNMRVIRHDTLDKTHTYTENSHVLQDIAQKQTFYKSHRPFSIVSRAVLIVLLENCETIA